VQKELPDCRLIVRKPSHKELMSRVTKDEKIKRGKQVCILGSVITSTCGVVEDVKTRIQKASAVSAQFYQAWKASRAIHCNIVGAVISNVYYYGCKMQKENPIWNTSW